jgi:2-oxoglutarate ferredoxin oxidoreductase subunit alpha
MGRILGSVVKMARKQGIKVGLFRPISLWPFPYAELKAASKGMKFCLDVEMSTGQMVEDVRLSVEGALPVHFYGRTGGMVPTPDEVLRELVRLIG